MIARNKTMEKLDYNNIKLFQKNSVPPLLRISDIQGGGGWYKN